jgi:signal transduction histidine kinase
MRRRAPPTREHFQVRVRLRYALPLAYGVVGIAWIVGPDRMLGYAAHFGASAQDTDAFKGLLFVLASAALLFLVQRAHDELERRVADRTQELEAAKNTAEHSDRVKSAFLSTVSHELRTPLNSIVGFTDVLLQGLPGPLTEQQARQLGIVRASAAHLRSLIEDVLDISRIEAGQVGLEYGDVDVDDLVALRVASFQGEAARKHLDLEFVSPDDVPMIRCDARRLAQIVDKLLSNALKFTEHGRVAVELRVAADRLDLSVVDTGVGIAPEALALLFTPFTQVTRPGGRVHDGTGLGLAIARNLARALGGDIVATSEQGRGSRFTLTVPRLATEPPAVASLVSQAVSRRPGAEERSAAT